MDHKMCQLNAQTAFHKCVRCLSCWFKSRNLSRSQQYKLVEQRRAHEEHKQLEALRVDRDRKMVATMKEEDSVDRKRFLRQVQEEQKEREIENAMVKVCFLATESSFPTVLSVCQVNFCFQVHETLSFKSSVDIAN